MNRITHTNANPLMAFDNPATGRDFILLDVSGSMAAMVYRQRRIDVLADIFSRLLPEFPTCRIVAFGSDAYELRRGASLPEPAGSTALHLALSLIANYRPERVAVLSDGVPDDAATALTLAKSLSCFIATYFCGDEDDHAAIAFMRALAWSSADGIGRSTVVNLKKPQKLASDLRLLLTGPAP